jgi:hypothetical protein
MYCFFLFESCIFPLSSNYRHDRLANKEHKFTIEGIEICQHAQRRKHQAFWLDEKRGKNEREILFYFAKKKKKSIIF